MSKKPKEKFIKTVKVILAATIDGDSQAKLADKTRLNQRTCRKYLTFLTGKGLLMKGELSPWRFSTTKRGEKFLDGFKKLETEG